MTDDLDPRELARLEAEMGELFTATRSFATPTQIAQMTRRAGAIGRSPGGPSWWQSLRWLAAGAALSAAALLALALLQPGQLPGPTRSMVAARDVAGIDQAMALGSLESLDVSDDVLEFSFFLTEEDEWTIATSFDLFYGPLPDDDPAQWDGLYDHLLAENAPEEVLF
jgi:hypothetical protein